MTSSLPLRIAIILAGAMGACGVALAAASAHLPDATRLGSASSMLLFHAAAILGAEALTRHTLVRHSLGVLAAFGFVLGAALFAGDLTMRQYLGHGLFPMAPPTGGTILLLSWLVLATGAAWPRRS
ncbi:MAG: membrane protein [Rhodocyclaceae bacterium]|nr:MAG: membrane protein [Rhodocyclaceae bacterium]